MAELRVTHGGDSASSLLRFRGHIKDYISRLNRVRREQPALQRFDNLRFYHADNDNVLFYCKHTDDHKNIVLAVVNLDPYRVQEAQVQVPLHELGLRPADETYQVHVHELITDKRFFWKGAQNRARITPESRQNHARITPESRQLACESRHPM